MLGLAIAAGSGVFYDQSYLLLKSIESNLEEEHHTTIFLPKDEASDLSESQIEFYKDHGELVIGEYPIKDHKMSAKQAALREAEKKSADTHILLDCDTLVLNDLDYIRELFDSNTDLLLCREHAGWPHWATHEAEEQWREIYSLIDAEFPGYSMRAVFDNTQIPPYWNGGVVATKRNIAEEWIKYIRELRQKFGPDLFYAEQLALPLLAHQYGVSILPVEYNYPSFMYLRVPEDVRIIHYSEMWHLARILERDIKYKMDEIDAYSMEKVPTGLNRLKAISHGIGVRAFREIVRKQLPKLRK